MDRVLKVFSLILQVFGLLLFLWGDKQIATYLMAQAAFTAAMVNWR